MTDKKISEDLLKILVCPKDKAPVEKTTEGDLKCTKCGKIYKVIDGIPVMLPDEYLAEESDSTKTDNDDKKNLKLKAHPLLSKDRKKRQKFVSATSVGAEDPFLRILDQHTAHKIRVAKIIAVIFLIFVALFIIYAIYAKIKNESLHDKKVNSIAMKVSDCRKLMEQNTGYNCAKAALTAIYHLENLKIIDWQNLSEWEGRKDFFKKEIERNFEIKSGLHFVCPSAHLDMICIPQGVFQMGSTIKDKRSEEDEFPQRSIIINYEFWLSATEISNMQFRFAYPNHNVEDWAGEKLNRLSQPAVMLDWHMAMSYCRYLNEIETKAGRVPEGYEYRLPTEAEWEYAARAGTTTIFFWGDSFGDEAAKFANTFDLKTAQIHKWKTEKGMASNDGFVASAPVGSFKPNAFALFDTCGNVWEWCWDWYNPRAYKELDVISPVQTKPVQTELEMRGTFDRIYYIEGTSRVIRGGSWGNLPSSCRTANRDSAVPETKNTGIGFRIALAPKIEKLTAKTEAPR